MILCCCMEFIAILPFPVAGSGAGLKLTHPFIPLVPQTLNRIQFQFLQALEIAAHIMTLPLPKLSTFLTHKEAKRLFMRWQNGTHHGVIFYAIGLYSVYITALKTGPNCGLLVLIPCCHIRLRTVYELILLIMVHQLKWLLRQQVDSVHYIPRCSVLIRRGHSLFGRFQYIQSAGICFQVPPKLCSGNHCQIIIVISNLFKVFNVELSN